MATLYFKVSSDWQEVVRLRQECEKLESQLKKMDSRIAPAATKALETQLASTKQQMMGLVTEAAKAGVAMENDLKRKIDSVTKSSDELSSEIIKQRTIIRETQEDVRRLSEQYSKMGKYSPQSTSTLNQLNKAKSALNEQKYALGELQDQQARNRLELRQLTREYRDFSQGTDKATVTVDALMASLKRTAAEIGGLAAIQKFGSDVINATGTMQQLHVALSTILQDGDKASKLISEITQFAAKTPFNLEDVASGAKQLLAYGSSAETVVDELSMLGDVASGLQIPIGQLIYLYGTLRTQGRAMTVDIRQFAGRGIPIYEELAKVLGVSKDQVGELVTAGKVGFKEVEQAFKNMTSEGGKFNELMENSAGTWPQRMSNIQDTLFQKLNDFGNKYKEVFEFGIGTAEDLVTHLDDVISVIGGLIAAYGTYKAALIATAVAQKAVGFIDSVRLIAAYRKELGLATAAQQAFNVAARSNVYVTLLSVLVGLGTAIYMFTKRTNEAMAAQDALSNVNKKANEEFSAQAATIDRLNGVLKSETASLDQKKRALSELQAIVPNYNAKLDEEGKLINNNTEAIKAYLVQLEKQIRLKAAQEELEELYRKKRVQEKNVQAQQSNYDRIRKQNPIGVVYGGDAGIEAQRHSLNRIANAEDALKKANNELKNTQTQIAAIEKEIDKTSLSSKGELPKSDITKEIETVTDRIKTLKQEIAGLRRGDLRAEAGKTVESVIEAKTKELQQAEKSLETLTGIKTGSHKKQKKPIIPSITVQDEEITIITPEEIQKNIDLHRDMMDKYLIDYGTYQQKREAIADSYAMKIANAETEGEKLSLQKKMEEAISAVDLEQFKEGINWELIFGDVSKASKKALEEMRSQLERFRDSQEYKDMTVEQKEVIDSALNEIKSTMIENGGLLGDLPNQLNALREAQEELTVAQAEYNRALESGTEAEKQQARSNLNVAQNRVATQEANVSRATEKTINSMRTLSGAIAQLGSDSEITLTELGGMAESIGSLFGEMGSKIGGIIGAALSVLDQIGQQGVEGFTENLNKSLAGAARSLLEYGTFGLIDFGGLSNRNVDSDIDRLTNSNEALRDALDRLTERMEESAVSEANDIYELQKANILAQEANTRKMMLEYGSVHDDGFLGIGGSHSSFKYIDDAMDAKDWERISQVVGQSVRNASDFFNLSSENMAKVADEANDLYDTIKQHADDGTRDAAQYMDDYIQYYKELEELEDSRNERLTSVSFDTVRDNFKNTLLDMESDSEDFARNFSDMMNEAIVESLMSEKYDDLLKDWYGKFAESMTDGVLTELERESLRKEYDSIVNQGLADRDALSSVLGSTVEGQGSSQTATRGYQVAVSQDSVDELSGRATAIQMAVEEIKNQRASESSSITSLNASIASLVAATQSGFSISDEIRSILANSYLELQEIRENTGAVVKPIQQMQKDIEIVRRNTERL